MFSAPCLSPLPQLGAPLSWTRGFGSLWNLSVNPCLSGLSLLPHIHFPRVSRSPVLLSPLSPAPNFFSPLPTCFSHCHSRSLSFSLSLSPSLLISPPPSPHPWVCLHRSHPVFLCPLSFFLHLFLCRSLSLLSRCSPTPGQPAASAPAHPPSSSPRTPAPAWGAQPVWEGRGGWDGRGSLTSSSCLA